MGNTLLRVDLTTGNIEAVEPGEYARYGGRGLTSMIVSRSVPPTCHPLSAENVLVFAPGLLSGTNAANSGRLSVGAKSPLTGTIKESNVGGTASYRLARLGIHGIVVIGKAAPGKLSYLLINSKGASLHDAVQFKGLKNYNLVQKLHEQYGRKAGIISIGPAGEMKLTAASIAVTDTNGNPSRHAGRGGLGAVMGSKGLKAIVIDDSGASGVEYADKEGFKAAATTFRNALTSHPVTKPGEGGLATYGTNILTSIINEAGAFPTRNFTGGQFEGARKLSAETMVENIKKRGGSATHAGCTGCIMQCSNVYPDKDGNYLTSALEYETVWANGANCGIDDLDAVALIDRLCDDYGLDTIEVGVAIGVAMSAGVKEFGDAEGAAELVHEIGRGTPLGRILGSGATATGKAFGVTDVPAVKGQALPAYDPRAIKGIGVTYATSTMGADHTAGYTITANILGCGGSVNPLGTEGQVDLSRNLQIATATLDAAGLCVFTAFALLDNLAGLEAIPQMLNGRYGGNLTLDDITKLGKEILKKERSFNQAAGFTAASDRLPDFFKTKPVAPHNGVFDVSDEELDTVFDF